MFIGAFFLSSCLLNIPKKKMEINSIDANFMSILSKMVLPIEISQECLFYVILLALSKNVITFAKNLIAFFIIFLMLEFLVFGPHII